MIHDIGARARSGSSRAIPAGCCLRRTRLGHVAVLWSVREGRPQIDRILLPTPQLPDEVRAGMARSRGGRFACPEIDLIADRIAALLAGEDVRFLADDVPLPAETVADRLRQTAGVWLGTNGPRGFRAVTHYWIGPKDVAVFLGGLENVLARA